MCTSWHTDRFLTLLSIDIIAFIFIPFFFIHAANIVQKIDLAKKKRINYLF